MYTFSVRYKDGSSDKFQSIETVTFVNIIGDEITVSGDDLLTAEFPVGRDYHLIGAGRNYSVGGTDVRAIAVLKE